MTVAGFVIGVVALLLAGIALLGEILKRPRLEIEQAAWEGTSQFPWEFLVVRVFNRPLTPWATWLFTRRSAEACQLSLTFFTGAQSNPVIDQIPGRWSAAPEPLSWHSASPRPDPSKLPYSYRLDVPTTGSGEEVAIARSRDGQVYAFSAESYLYHHWRRPGWELPQGRWTVLIRAASSDAQTQTRLGFEVSKAGGLSWS